MTAKPVPRRGRPAADDQTRARRREELLACAARVFARNGYPGTDMQAVADAAGVAKGTLYLYFSSKEEMFLAAVDQGITRLRDFIDSQTADLPDTLQRIGAAIHAYLHYFKDHPELAELLIQERAEFRDRKTPTYFQHRQAGRAKWHAILRDLITAGRLRDVPISRIDDVLSDLVYGTMFTNHFSGRHKPLEEQAHDILDIVHHGILSETERRKLAQPRRNEA